MTATFAAIKETTYYYCVHTTVPLLAASFRMILPSFLVRKFILPPLSQLHCSPSYCTVQYSTFFLRPTQKQPHLQAGGMVWVGGGGKDPTFFGWACTGHLLLGWGGEKSSQEWIWLGVAEGLAFKAPWILFLEGGRDKKKAGQALLPKETE